MYYHTIELYSEITCQNCVVDVSTLLDINEKNFKIHSHREDLLQRKISITVISKDADPENIKRELIALLKTKLINKEVKDMAATRQQTKQKRRKEWILGILGSALGSLQLIFSLIFAGSIGLPILILIGVCSSLLTLYLGFPYYKRALEGLKNKRLTMDVLFTLSSLIVLTVSVAAFFFPGLPMMFETGLLMFGFRQLGSAIENTLLEAVQPLSFKKHLPKMVQKITNNTLEKTRLVNIKPLDKLKILPGALIPIDGVCMNDCDVDDTIVSGATSPRRYKKGDSILAGTQLTATSPALTLGVSDVFISLKKDDIVPVDCITTSPCYIWQKDHLVLVNAGTKLAAGFKVSSDAHLKVENVSQYSYLDRLDRVIAEAENKKAPVEETTNKILHYFIPGVLGLALLAGILMAFLFSPLTGIQCAASLLVAACPCTLGMITPLAMRIGMDKASKQGMVFKHEADLQAANDIDSFVFDLNGTLTEGTPSVVSFETFAGFNEAEVLNYVAHLEQDSSHAIARTIRSYLHERNFTSIPSDKGETEVHHSGVKAKINGKVVLIGNQDMLLAHDIAPGNATQLPLALGQTQIYIADADKKKLMGRLIISDSLKRDAKETIRALQQWSEVYICTGADQATACRYAKELGIHPDKVFGNCTSIKQKGQRSKLDVLAELKRKGKVAMIGDGANDAAAMSFASFGIAVGSITSHEVTRHRANAVIKENALLAIPKGFNIVKETVRHIKQNLSFSLIYNLSAALLSGGFSVLLFGFALNPAIGVVLMVVQASLLMLNAYRIKCKEIPRSLFPPMSQVIEETQECVTDANLTQTPMLQPKLVPSFAAGAFFTPKNKESGLTHERDEERPRIAQP